MNTRMLAACLAAAVAAPALADTTTTFDNGLEGWSISGRTDINPTGGNPGANLHGVLIDVFGADIRNNTNDAFLGDLSRYGMLELSIDIQVNSINFFGQEVPRDLVVELRDYTNNNGYPWTSVYYNLGTLQAVSEGNDGWVTYSVIIEDPFAVGLPDGWGGYGDETPLGDPILPAGRTFASVLASVDEISFTTFVPGFFFGFTNFDIQVDNIAIRTVPAPSAVALLGFGGLVGARRRR
jgi:hypothetical protein